MLDLHSVYHTVCDTPGGAALNIDHMPAFFDYDLMDNSIPHVHTFYEIMRFQEAGGHHNVDFVDYPIERNTLLFLAPGQVHHFDGVTRHKGVLIQFCTDFMRDEQTDEDIFLKYDVFNTYDSSPCYVIDSDDVARRLAVLVRQMEEERAVRTAFGHTDMLRSLVRQFLILVRRHSLHSAECVHLDTLKPSHRLFVRFRQLVEHEFTVHHMVSYYADALAVPVRTLSSSVKECSGKSPLAIINGRLLLEAKRLLLHSDLSQKEIAYRLGFDDTSYFAKQFRRLMGVSPIDFRTAASSPAGV